ncbi:hypothetical protein [Curtobacterium luteum]|uniref:Cardiolipin synthase N-terminal domain-containing protein n=1 Tax=Curtobacterium luteum TaxID=33881 RepID=A0A175REV6_9MICO|nr:hypothetical protein [Curtobacterium luteum]KTR02347.1 hypothetical protein NS184_16215 [Curtobacterium luteum]
MAAFVTDHLVLVLELVWLSIAILSGGHARTRNRRAWTWFLLTLFLGPLALMLLVAWPPRAHERRAGESR